ncbi:TetR family transcriptional regulator [Branchiibius hedensis]|uniref:DNA-binding transcriptional regulator, AcrR family n=1 Tax=Branchiibius hedensis TaxID=672460 RepID=A0A2Y8ZT28_9MICO|nr:TetR/AcrR family transcriptional regulator [Branchiibius hedensis]PWJ25833.1 TetR family transcriptional regulator [Branchiibius hedensis]SSA34646.1 DNA-binding transcriptional regulator, AcrR family [Branchiibius hedensis]
MRADAAANATAITAAARQLLATHGADIPLSAVAQQAGVGIATLYRHFGTREELFLAVAQDLRDQALATIERHRDQLNDDPEKAWSNLVHDLASTRPGALIPGLLDIAADESLREDLTRIRGDILSAFEEVLRSAKAAGLVERDLSAARFQLGLATLTRPLPEPPLPDLPTDGLGDWLTEVYLRGLRPQQQ